MSKPFITAGPRTQGRESPRARPRSVPRTCPRRPASRGWTAIWLWYSRRFPADRVDVSEDTEVPDDRAGTGRREHNGGTELQTRRPPTRLARDRRRQVHVA